MGSKNHITPENGAKSFFQQCMHNNFTVQRIDFGTTQYSNDIWRLAVLNRAGRSLLRLSSESSSNTNLLCQLIGTRNIHDFWWIPFSVHRCCMVSFGKNQNSSCELHLSFY